MDFVKRNPEAAIEACQYQQLWNSKFQTPQRSRGQISRVQELINSKIKNTVPKGHNRKGWASQNSEACKAQSQVKLNKVLWKLGKNR